MKQIDKGNQQFLDGFVEGTFNHGSGENLSRAVGHAMTNASLFDFLRKSGTELVVFSERGYDSKGNLGTYQLALSSSGPKVYFN